MTYVRRGGYVVALVLLSLLGQPRAWAELTPGEVLGQENWQQAKGLLPEAVLHRFQEGSYQAKIIALSDTMSWGSKFKAASET
ncbi:MAG: hypothetical protein HY268_30575, partial [Deltaproteobacteria bacterium]|nr:hypothetical protein [Deltaproteobacteria bacterium]